MADLKLSFSFWISQPKTLFSEKKKIIA